MIRPRDGAAGIAAHAEYLVFVDVADVGQDMKAAKAVGGQGHRLRAVRVGLVARLTVQLPAFIILYGNGSCLYWSASEGCVTVDEVPGLALHRRRG